MKKLFTIIFLLTAFLASGQVDTTRALQAFQGYGIEYKNLAANGFFRLPRDTVKLKVADSGSIAYKNGGLYLWRLGKWNVASGGGSSFDSTYIYAQVNARVQYSDTALMLLAYRNALLSRVFYSDTANMLAAYRNSLLGKINYSDSTGFLQAYATALNGRVRYTDTSDMLSAYQTALNLRAALSHTHDDRYYTEGEVTTFLSGKANSSHTHIIGNVTGLQDAIDGKLSLSDTATVLSSYRDAINLRATLSQVILNQTSVVQDAAFAITGPLRVGTTIPLDGRFNAMFKDSHSDNSGFTLMEFKTYNDDDDLNLGGAALVKHDRDYSLTGGYANTFQVYGLAGTSTIIGSNSFTGNTTPYTPTVNSEPNGYIRFEVGPVWPKSEKVRFNPDAAIFGWTTLRDYEASQTGDVVTDPVNSFFASDVGKYFLWGNQGIGGKWAFADSIIEYIDANNIRVNRSRTIASQGGRVAQPNIRLDYNTGNARINIGHFDSLRVGTDASYYRFVPSAGALSLLRAGSSSPDTLFDISGTSRLKTGRDIELSGSHYSQALFKNSTTDLFRLTANANETELRGLTAAPLNTYSNGVWITKTTSTKFQAFKPIMSGPTDDTPLGWIDVRNNDKNITAYIDNTRGTGTNFGLLVDVTAGSTENRAGYFTATGGTTDKAIMVPASSGSDANDYGLSIETAAKNYLNGKLGIGVSDAAAKLHSFSTTEQLRLGYDASNYVPFTVSSSGDLTIAPTGGDIVVTGNLSPSTLVVGSVDNTEFSYLNGVSSAIQGQIDGKGNLSGGNAWSGTQTIATIGSAADLAITPTGGDVNITGDVAISGKIKYKDEALQIATALGSNIKGAILGGHVFSNSGTSYTLVDGTIFWCAAWLSEDATLTGLKFWQSAQGDYTADNNNRVGLYTYDGAGTLTQVAASTNNGNLWKGSAASTQTVTFSSTYVATAGMYYIAFIYNNSASTTPPTIGTVQAAGNSSAVAFDFTNSAKTFGTTSGTNLPSTQAMSSITGNTPRPYFAMY